MLIVIDNARDETNKDILTSLAAIFKLQEGEALTVTISKGRVEARKGRYCSYSAASQS